MAGLDKNTAEHIPGENVVKQSRDDLQTDFIMPQGDRLMLTWRPARLYAVQGHNYAATTAYVDYSSG